MNELYQDIISVLDHYALPAGLALLVLAIIVFLSGRRIKQSWLNLKTRNNLNQLGNKQIADFQCPDGLGHYSTIDRLILRNNGITLLIYKRYPGKIFCGDQINDWIQMVGKRSYRFKNPLYDLDNQIKAVSACVPGITVNGFLFFDHLTEFPKGHSDRILRLNKIPEELERNKKDKVEASVMIAWKQLLQMAKG